MADIVPDEIQQAIIDRCQDGVSTIHQWAVRQYKMLSDQLGLADVSPQDLDLRELITTRDVSLSKMGAEARDELRRLRLTERAYLREENLFKHENRLSRAAHYPESRLLAISLLAVAVVGESVFNSQLFAAVNPLGLLGGWLQAFLVSATNVLVGLMFGLFVLRNLHSVAATRRTIAFITLPVGMIVLVGFNLCVAHYRDLLTLDRDLLTLDPYIVTAVLDRVRADPLGLRSLEALMLLVV